MTTIASYSRCIRLLVIPPTHTHSHSLTLTHTHSHSLTHSLTLRIHSRLQLAAADVAATAISAAAMSHVRRLHQLADPPSVPSEEVRTYFWSLFAKPFGYLSFRARRIRYILPAPSGMNAF
eukprot:1186680-Prorocentrum_minimum.AAC.2